VSISIEEAYQLVENLDYEKGLKRKFAPQYSLIQINRDGTVASVRRFKSVPTEDKQKASLRENPDTFQINGSPGMYESLEEFRERIEEDMWLFSKMKKPTAED